MRRHGLFEMPTISSDGHLFESKLDEKMETNEDSPAPTNTDPDGRTLVNADECAGVDPGGRAGVDRVGVNPEDEKEEPAEIKMRYKCYILPPILYPDGRWDHRRDIFLFFCIFIL